MFNPIKPELVFAIFKYSVRASKRTPHFAITKINWLMMFEEVIAVFNENHAEPNNAKCRRSYLLLKWLVHIVTIQL
jgi:hypothetical protein